MSSKQELSAIQKLTVSAITGLVFLIISSPFMYRLVNAITTKIGFSVSDSEGCPTVVGLIVHTLVFILIVFGLMYLPIGKGKKD